MMNIWLAFGISPSHPNISSSNNHVDSSNETIVTTFTNSSQDYTSSSSPSLFLNAWSSNSPSFYVDTPSNNSSSTKMNPLNSRHSQRTRNPPIHLKDYVIKFHQKLIFLWKIIYHYPILSKYHRAFHTNIIENEEPKYISQAMKFTWWPEAIAKAIQSHESNNTRLLCALPEGKTTIGCKWVYKINYWLDSYIESYKVFLVAKGYMLIEGIDYHDTFAPITKPVTL